MIPKRPNIEADVTDLNAVVRFLSRTDVPQLTPASLLAHTGLSSVDLLVLIGNSVLHTAVKAADGWRQGIAEKLLIAGGIGHSTSDLRRNVQNDPRFSEMDVEEQAEADIFGDLLVQHFGIDESKILLERNSTNCGANASEVYRLLSEHDKRPKTMLIVQDPVMQLRTHASFRRVWSDDPGVRFINCPTFVPLLKSKQRRLAFARPDLAGLWSMERFLSLVMGEIPRLRDDENGYGPRGRGYIEHVDIPAEIEASYERLLPRYGRYARHR